jgi:Astacin (Peptidase family M12A)
MLNKKCSLAMIVIATSGCAMELATDDEVAEIGQKTQAAFPSNCGSETMSCALTTWPAGTIPYQFSNDNGDFAVWNQADRDDVINAMTEWEDATGGIINFRAKTSSDTAYASFSNEIRTGCNSVLGMDNPNGANLVRLRQCQDVSRHELGHLIGLSHVHQRNDRDRYLQVDLNDICFPPDPPINHCEPADYFSPGVPINDYCGYQDPINGDDFSVYRNQKRSDGAPRCSSAADDIGPFNFSSLMLYPAGGHGPDCDVTNVDGNCCSATNLASCTITRRDGSTHGSWFTGGAGINAGDASAVVELYRRPEGWDTFRPIARLDPGPTTPLDMRLTSSVTMVGSPALARYGTATAIAARGNNQHYYVKLGSAVFAKQSWSDVGGDYTSDPAMVSWGTGRLDLVGIGTDGNVWHRGYENGVWSDAGNIGRPGTTTPSDPAIASWGANRLDIFVRSGLNLYQKTWTSAGWSSWANRGGDFKGKPAAVSWGANRIDLVGVGVDNAVWHKGFANGNWETGFRALEGAVASGSGPAIASAGTDNLNIYVRGSNGMLWVRSWTSQGWSASWRNLGGLIAGSPGAATLATGKAYVVAPITTPTATSTIRGAWYRFWE